MFSLIALFLLCGYNINSLTATKSTIPDTCYSPSGTSCSWYRNCLEAKHPCNSSGYPYALSFAERFCNLYGKQYNWFSRQAQKWIDGVRKCLQVSLVDLLRVANIRCHQLQSRAFASHTPCYLNPGPALPSVCDLHCGEYLKIFWTIKGAFVSQSSAGPTFKAMWHVSKGCGLRWAVKTAACSVVSAHQALFRRSGAENRKLIAVTRLHVEVSFAKRNSAGQTDGSFADQVAMAVSKSLKWNPKVIDWFAFSENKEKSKHGRRAVMLVLADKRDFASPNPKTPHISLKRVLSDLGKASKNSKLTLQLEGGKVRLLSIELCKDVFCQRSTGLKSPLIQ